MESSIECISFIDGMDEEEISQPHPFSQFSSPKPSHNNSNTNNLNGGVINKATSVHELLECPVCTNSMYPPIHQVSHLHLLSPFPNFFLFKIWSWFYDLGCCWSFQDWILLLAFLINWVSNISSCWVLYWKVYSFIFPCVFLCGGVLTVALRYRLWAAAFCSFRNGRNWILWNDV